jgi:hypothetical protein
MNAQDTVQDKVLSIFGAILKNGAKFTGKELLAAWNYARTKAKEHDAKIADSKATVGGKVSLAELKSGKDYEIKTLELENADKTLKRFKAHAKRYGVSYDYVSDKTDPTKLVLMFRAREEGQVERAFKDYAAEILKLKDKTPLMKRINEQAAKLSKEPKKEKSQKQDKGAR